MFYKGYFHTVSEEPNTLPFLNSVDDFESQSFAVTQYGIWGKVTIDSVLSLLQLISNLNIVVILRRGHCCKLSVTF
jgi:hypothetical protein